MARRRKELTGPDECSRCGARARRYLIRRRADPTDFIDLGSVPPKADYWEDDVKVFWKVEDANDPALWTKPDEPVELVHRAGTDQLLCQVCDGRTVVVPAGPVQPGLFDGMEDAGHAT